MMERAKESLDLGILVSDIKSSLNFYQNILGLEFIEERSVWFGTMYRLRFGTSDFKLIVPNILPPKGPIGLESQLGFRYVTFVIKNLSEFCKELQDRKIDFVVPEKELRPGVRIAMVKDPDGNIVEFVQRTK
jgi:catechol 2,3-dioxygenase-like lactoylglutathione lyase family enzyme